MRPIDADVLYERATTLEAQALDYVGKLIERDGDEPSVEWKVWSAILAERTAFKHDLMDAPTIDAVEVVRCKDCNWWWKEWETCTHKNLVDGYTCATTFKADDFCSYGERRER